MWDAPVCFCESVKSMQYVPACQLVGGLPVNVKVEFSFLTTPGIFHVCLAVLFLMIANVAGYPRGRRQIMMLN